MVVCASTSTAQTENGSVAGVTQAASAMVSAVTPSVGMTDAEHREWTHNLEERKFSRDRWNNCRAWITMFFSLLTFLGVAVTLYFTYKRLVVMEQRAKEEELSSYRERLFSDDPSARIAAAMSLAKYPEEGIWLYSRLEGEHKLIQETCQRILHVDPGKFDLSRSLDTRILSLIEKRDNFERVKQAIEGAIAVMRKEVSWDSDYSRKTLLVVVWRRFRGLKWARFRIGMGILWRSGVDCLGGRRKVKGPRLDRKQITFDVGRLPLRGAYLRKSDLHEARLQNKNLGYAHLEDANLWGAHLERAILRFAHLERARIQGAYLEGADLTQVVLEGANLEGARLEGANLRAAQIGYAIFRDANLESADLIDANLVGADLTRAKLKRADLIEANLRYANLCDADLSGADLSGASLRGANLEGANLGGTNLERIKDWKKVASIEDANIHGVENAPDGFVQWAKKKGARDDMSTEEWKAWKERDRPSP